jgi:hypothetical protein
LGPPAPDPNTGSPCCKYVPTWQAAGFASAWDCADASASGTMGGGILGNTGTTLGGGLLTAGGERAVGSESIGVLIGGAVGVIGGSLLAAYGFASAGWNTGKWLQAYGDCNETYCTPGRIDCNGNCV